jgi:hypothetical protein
MPESALSQLTLDGSEADHRVVPDTMMWCPECENNVLRSNRDTHPHELEEEKPLPHEDDDNDLEEDCLIDTQQWEVTFYTEHRETVVVEASHKSEAKTAAKRARTYDGQFTHDLHTERRAVSDESQATIEYLETYGLLPEDHNVTPEHIEEINRRYDDD